MPAGDLVVADYTMELRLTLMGAGTNYELNRSSPFGGLGVPQPKQYDVEFAHKDGSYGGSDRNGVRVVTVAFELWDSPAVALAALKQLHTIWAVSTVDIPLYIQLPGFGKFHINGRPRGVVDNIDIPSPSACKVDALATFVTTVDHTIFYP